jgi:hypothetical protein
MLTKPVSSKGRHHECLQELLDGRKSALSSLRNPTPEGVIIKSRAPPA